MICFYNQIFLLSPLPLTHKQPEHQEQYERYIYRLETMQEQVHGQNRHERGEESGREREEHPGDGTHNGAEEEESDDSSFDELLDIPTLGNVIVLGGFYVPAVDGSISEFHNIAIGGAGCSESLSHGVFGESLEPGHRTVKMPLRRSGTEDDPIDGSLIPEIKQSGKDGEKEEYCNAFFLVFPPDGSEGKYNKSYTSDDDSDKSTARIGEE
ncbi:MAG: hypothetical protein ACD_71C00187G0008, partial [uncultured bacterium (gcode 4)]